MGAHAKYHIVIRYLYNYQEGLRCVNGFSYAIEHISFNSAQKLLNKCAMGLTLTAPFTEQTLGKAVICPACPAAQKNNQAMEL
jgi:hypothetical protein